MTYPLSRRQVHYVAQECMWQRSGELSVSWMADALDYALKRRNSSPTVDDVLALGGIVEPKVNRRGFRTCRVWVGYDEKLEWQYIESHLPKLIASIVTCPMNADDASAWFKRYEDIHPFADGNGRTGSILYNWVRRSLEAPSHPPNLWNDSRREIAGYPDPTKIARRR